MYRALRLCSNHGGFEAVPDRPRPLDLARVKSLLERDGIAVVDARVLLIVSLETEVTISRSGRLLFKTKDRGAADRAWGRLRSLLGLPGLSTQGSLSGAEPSSPRVHR